MLISQYFSSNPQHKVKYTVEQGKVQLLDPNKGTKIEVEGVTGDISSKVNFSLNNENLEILIHDDLVNLDTRLILTPYQNEEITFVSISEKGVFYNYTVAPNTSEALGSTELIVSQQIETIAPSHYAGLISKPFSYLAGGIATSIGALTWLFSKTSKSKQDNDEVVSKSNQIVDKSDEINEVEDEEIIEISGELAGTTTEDEATTTITGKLESPVPFSPQVEKVSGDLGGQLTIQPDGSWTYQRDDSNANVQALIDSESAVEKFTVQSANGKATQEITITVAGKNDVAKIAGQTDGLVYKQNDNSGSQSGQLTILDPDHGQNAFSAGDYTGRYGTLTLEDNGRWVYRLDSNNPSVKALGVNQSLQDIITIKTVDGTTEDINVNIVETFFISGTLWFDQNNDMKRARNEGVFQRAKVVLKNHRHETIDEVFTNNQGRYTFQVKNVAVGDYYLQFDRTSLPANMTFFVGGDSQLANVSGQSITINNSARARFTINAGVKFVPGAVEGKLFDDYNFSGQPDGSEKGIENVTVRLLKADNSIVATTQTDKSGNYRFADIDQGQYKVVFGELANGAHYSDSNTYPVQVNVQQTSRVNVATYQLATVSGTAWYDENRDQQLTSEDNLLTDLTVQLLNTQGEVVATTTTDERGQYSFSVRPGEYKVAFARKGLETGQHFVDQERSESHLAITAGETEAFSLYSGQVKDQINAMAITERPTASLVGKVWLDANANGIQDANESGIEGISVELLDSNKRKVMETVTDAEGNYRFETKDFGYYIIRSGGRNGLNFTASNVGGDESKDSDIVDTHNGNTAKILLSANQHQVNIGIGLKPNNMTVTSLNEDIQGYIQNVNSDSHLVEGDNVGRYVTLRIDPSLANTSVFSLAEIRVWSNVNWSRQMDSGKGIFRKLN
ncbi:SdrD B-like domain-containing protein [Gallibacterium trehalosifermentans]|uniref:SdrD B-like domain-containing protein n=1 Tax=Gallibacterium trehalosifermentans TaxID=516935 RepID=A0ABV6H2R5_9PAST